jgi:hypothetical protein
MAEEALRASVVVGGRNADLQQTSERRQEMKGKTSRIVVVLVAVALLTAFAPVAGYAKGNKTEFTGIETWRAEVDPGVWVTLPSGNVHARGVITQYLEESSDPQMAGTNTVVMNANLVPPDYSGPVWGTFYNEVVDGVDCPGGGAWEGTWAGMVKADGACFYHAVGHGISGCVEGMLVKLTADCTSETTTFAGTILDPHGQ